MPRVNHPKDCVVCADELPESIDALVCLQVFYHQCITDWMCSYCRSNEQELEASLTTGGSSSPISSSGSKVQEVDGLTFEEQ